MQLEQMHHNPLKIYTSLSGLFHLKQIPKHSLSSLHYIDYLSFSMRDRQTDRHCMEYVAITREMLM